ncbi:hypothetical protein Sjap_009116 [Stephania japonica]|uniref:S-protein homolog n=1 Tax=Stephania japonica TaxID=461633 RepID=A0AAP0JQX0_9MAGN
MKRLHSLVLTSTFLLLYVTQVGFSSPFVINAPFDEITVHIRNQISPESVLYLHCRSKDDDLGVHYIYFDQEFHWHFRVNLWGTTLFWCNLSSPAPSGQPKNGSLVVFDAEHPICSEDCIYRVEFPGVCLVNQEKQTCEEIIKW